MKVTRNIITVNLLKIYFFLLYFQFLENSIFYIPFRLIPLLIILFESNYLINLVRLNLKDIFILFPFYYISISQLGPNIIFTYKRPFLFSKFWLINTNFNQLSKIKISNRYIFSFSVVFFYQAFVS